jgi:hypothetical protein
LVCVETYWRFQELLNCFKILITNTDNLNPLVEEAFLKRSEVGHRFDAWSTPRGPKLYNVDHAGGEATDFFEGTSSIAEPMLDLE